MTKKAFKDLTPQGQKKRLAQYDKERAERGTVDVLARVVKPANIKAIANDNEMAVFRLAVYNKGTGKTDFITASAFIKKGKDKLRDYYASLEKGQLVSVEIKESKGYKNIYNMMSREAKKNTKAADAAPAQEADALPA